MLRQHTSFQLLPVNPAAEGLGTVWNRGKRMKELPLCSPPIEPMVPITSAPAPSDLPPESEPEARACGFVPQTLMARKAVNERQQGLEVLGKQLRRKSSRRWFLKQNNRE